MRANIGSLNRCRSCAAELTDTVNFCSSCGEPVSAISQMPTGLATPSAIEAARRRSPSSASVGRLASSDAIDSGGFTPGAVILDRYRIIGLLGRGGMGEVYRADDLKIGQPVALKFLPKALSGDSAALSHFLAEVRLAREVSHPNVCRVYDIGELEGQHFLSMEYVDGENLASLLNRIGHLPADKALEIARQLCAGLAAAHERGVLHRDLKPSNIMIDGRGRARIADFGLAARAGEARSMAEQSGTPAYMAPEQFSGGGASVRSDVYCLGLVLYEIYTGRRVFQAGSVADLARRHAEEMPAPPSDFNRHMDPAVERLILRCLAKDPASRPSSALEVAAVLPGGDPLAAALAAGETPSPGMVAASGEKGELSPVAAGARLGALLLAILAIAADPSGMRLWRVAPLDKPPEFLAERAKEILVTAGARTPRSFTAFGFEPNREELRFFWRERKARRVSNDLSSFPVSPVLFWYRASPSGLVPTNDENIVRFDNPSLESPGTSRVVLDSRGRLISFHTAPADLAQQRVESEPDFRPLFAAAGLDLARFRPASVKWAPSVGSDGARAWEGVLPGRPDLLVHVAAASFGGQPVSFELKLPWDAPRKPEAGSGLGQDFVDIAWFLVTAAASIGAVFVARRNLLRKTGDRRGAFKMASFALVALLLSWAFRADYSWGVREGWDLFVRVLGRALYWSAMLWIVYIALEPFVRRRWPGMLVSWTRLLNGRLFDPLIGRDVLTGALFAAGIQILLRIQFLLPGWLLGTLPIPDLFGLRSLAKPRNLGGTFFNALSTGLIDGLGSLFLLLLFHLLLRKKALAVAGLILLATPLMYFFDETPVTSIPMTLLRSGLWIFLLVRFGLLAFAAGLAFWYWFMGSPATLDFSAWYAGRSLLAMTVIAAIGFAAFRSSLGRPIFQATPQRR